MSVQQVSDDVLVFLRCCRKSTAYTPELRMSHSHVCSCSSSLFTSILLLAGTICTRLLCTPERKKHQPILIFESPSDSQLNLVAEPNSGGGAYGSSTARALQSQTHSWDLLLGTAVKDSLSSSVEDADTAHCRGRSVLCSAYVFIITPTTNNHHNNTIYSYTCQRQVAHWKRAYCNSVA